MKRLSRQFRLCITTAETAAAKASGYAHTPINYLWKGLLNGKRKQKLYHFFSRDC